MLSSTIYGRSPALLATGEGRKAVALQDRQLRLAPCRKRLLDGGDLFRGQVQTIGPRVVLDMIAARRLGNGERPWQPGEERQRHLARRLVVRAGDLRQHLPALG